MEVLYRKYRPLEFDAVLGQEHIVSVLRKSIELERIAHAYLFYGTRGTGKTTMARIFAKNIGCEPNDIHEIDAASNRGIDDIRALREAVYTLPFSSPYKVYIIDEVHMLTKDAFNALLKTLEEPPKHVIFILATTELEKVLDTVISRCQLFTFKKPSQTVLKNMIGSIATSEGFTLEPSSAELIALLGDGSFRDTQGVLQKVLSSSRDKKITPEEVEMVTGAPSGQLVNEFLMALAENKKEDALSVIARVTEQNTDIETFMKLVLHKVRLILMVRFAPRMHAELKEEVGDNDFAFFTELAGVKGKVINSELLTTLLETYDQIGVSYIKQLPIELMVMKI